ncbi:MAG: hypothetical protein ACR2LF_05585 [Jatrophihabitantaceae bacterium]
MTGTLRMSVRSGSAGRVLARTPLGSTTANEMATTAAPPNTNASNGIGS